MTDTDDKAEVHARPFADSLREFDKGRLHDDLTTGLHHLIAAVLDTEKVGKLTLAIQVTPQSSDTDMVKIKADMKLTVPEHDRGPSMFYVDSNGNLTRQHPSQLAFESLRAVEKPADSDKIQSIQGEQQA